MYIHLHRLQALPAIRTPERGVALPSRSLYLSASEASDIPMVTWLSSGWLSRSCLIWVSIVLIILELNLINFLERSRRWLRTSAPASTSTSASSWAGL